MIIANDIWSSYGANFIQPSPMILDDQSFSIHTFFFNSLTFLCILSFFLKKKLKILIFNIKFKRSILDYQFFNINTMRFFKKKINTGKMYILG